MKLERHRLYWFFILVCIIPLVSVGQQSFTLDEAIQYAESNQNAVRLADIEIERADADINEFRSIGMPKLSGAIDYSYYYYVPKQPVQDFIGPTVYQILEAEGLPTTSQGPPQTFELAFVQPHQLNVGLSANMLVFDGSYVYGLKAARLYRELVKKQKESTLENIKVNVTKAYLAVLIAQVNQNTLQDNINTVNKSLSEAKAMYDAGFVESLDVDRLQLSLNNLNTQLENVNGLIDLSYNLLKFQMNYPQDEALTLSESIDELILKFDAEQSLAEEMNPENRVEYQLLQKSEELNELDLKRNKAGYYPNVAAFTSFQESLQRTNLFDNDEVGWLPTGVVGLSIGVPIYDGGEKKAKIQKVKLNQAKTEVQKQEFTNAMQMQVRNATIALTNAKNNLENTKTALKMNENIYEKVKIKFREGVGSSVEVNQAESSLYNAQSQYISALYDVLQSKVDLDIALGKL